MSILSSILTTFSNATADALSAQNARNQIWEAVQKASADGEITAEEIADIKKLAAKLDIDASYIQNLRLTVLKDLAQHISQDKTVTAGEMQLFEELTKEINPIPVEQIELKQIYEQLKSLMSEK
ncbi:MAG: hypothetical protein EAZ55_11190 [Cytophagales bacterium]|nr:MAG: hypothetical protein EAZ55_11190 [Cytophagales bacterium]